MIGLWDTMPWYHFSRFCISYTWIPLDADMTVLFGDVVMEHHTFQFGLIFILLTITAMYAVNSIALGVSCLVRAMNWRSVLKWTLKGLLMIILIIAIRLYMTVSLTSLIIFFLRSASGYIEQNPGLCQTKGNLTWLSYIIYNYCVGFFAVLNASISISQLKVVNKATVVVNLIIGKCYGIQD